MEEQNLEFLLAVHRTVNLTFLRFSKLKEFFHHDWKSVWNGKINEWQQSGVDKLGIEKFFGNRKNIDPEKEGDRVKKCGAKILIYGEQAYPFPLLTISNPPTVLFIKGDLLETDFPSVSVVGSRGVSAYGRRVIEEIIGKIAESGITIVSGLAIGADTLAHKTALKNKSRTICVLGNGIDFVYPEQNQRFAEQIIREKKGAIISEYFPGESARPENFPVRNRIVAGLSKITIVIEAAEKSGSLITAQLALEEGREVFAAPGDIFSKNSKGTNTLLLKSEAAPLLSAQQILELLGISVLDSQKRMKQNIPFTDEEKEILELFGTEHRMHINELIQKSKYPSSAISSRLALMELRGIVKNVGNQMYIRS